LLDERLEKLEFDNWTMRTTLSQMKLDGENATKELASIKVSAWHVWNGIDRITKTTRMTSR
jgi:hypothetical protein